ncbi:MAG TPA: hypothetical protein DIU48_03540 [Acidobacteria bacterium]|nr:hypothetical protein [Acidobacteriota bacterium]
MLVEVDDAPLPAVVGVPWPAVARAVVEVVQLGVIAEPPPDRTAPEPPGIAVPGIECRIRHPVIGIEGPKAWADAHIVVGPHVVVAPPHSTGVDVVSRDVPTNAAVAARHAEDDVLPNDQRCAGPDLRDRVVRGSIAPDDLSGAGV